MSTRFPLLRRASFGALILAVSMTACETNPVLAPGNPDPTGPLPAAVPGRWSEPPRVIAPTSQSPTAESAPRTTTIASASSDAEPWVTGLDAAPGLVWHHAGGDLSIWRMNGPEWKGSWAALPAVSPKWQVVAAADFDFNGGADLVWFNAERGMTSIWLMNGLEWSGEYALLPVVPAGWQIAAAADFNGDGYPDLVWQNVETGQRSIWFMNGTQWDGEYSLLPHVAPAWRIAAAIDMTGDGQPDLIWENTENGERSIWHMAGATWTGAFTALPTLSPEWRIVDAGDYTGNAKADLVLQSLVTREQMIWLMEGTTRSGTVALRTVPAGWALRAARQPPMHVRVCDTHDGGRVPTYAWLWEAAGTVGSTGTVRLCSGTFRAEGVRINRPLTMEPEPGAVATIHGSGTWAGSLLVNHEAGWLTIRGLRFTRSNGWVIAGRTPTQSTGPRHAHMLVEDATFDLSPDAAGISHFARPDARTIVRRSILNGGFSGFSAGEVVESRVTGVSGTAVSAYSAVGNYIEGCGEYCLEVFPIAPGYPVVTVAVVGNTIRNSSRTSYAAIRVWGIEGVIVENNVIEGTGPILDPSDRAEYPFQRGGILVRYTTCMTKPVVVRGNVVRNAARGYVAWNFATGCTIPDMEGSDNRAEDVHTAVATTAWGRFNLHRSDFIRYVDAIDMVDPPATVSPYQAGDLGCNWWGSAEGPVNVHPRVTPDVYTPFATEPIANSGRSC
jgi:putative cofactor-binding repeat protein